MEETLHQHRDIWRQKPVLQAIYDDFYQRIIAALRLGTTLEIGGGIGNLRQRLALRMPTATVVSSDIQFAPWLDCVADAQSLPFADRSITNIVMVDVCHHLEFPIKFLRESDRILRPGGRIIMIEPAITWGSTLFYRFLHQEPVRTSADPLVDGMPDPARDPYMANQAIPTLMATRDAPRFHKALPNLRISLVEWFSLAIYPLSGGFKRWSLIPSRVVGRALRLERAVEPLLGRFLAFRMMMVIEKRSD